MKSSDIKKGVLLFFIAMCIAAAFWRIAPDTFNSPENVDFQKFYLPVGINILNGQGISLDGKFADAYTPGFPVILACTLLPSKVIPVDRQVLLRIALAIMYGLGCLLIFLLAKTLWDSTRAMAAAGIWACCPLTLWTIKWPTTELPFMVAFYGAMLLILRGWAMRESWRLQASWFFWGGFVLGIAMLIRPIALGSGIVFAVLILLGKRHSPRARALFCLFLVCGNLAAILPWEARLTAQTHRILPLCHGRLSASIIDGLTFAAPNSPESNGGVSVPADVKSLMTSLAPLSGRDFPEFIRAAAVQAKKQPLTIIKLVGIKGARSWYATSTGNNEKLLMVLQGIFMMLLLWSFARIYRLHPEFRYLVLAGAVFICYFWSMSILVLPLARYMAPVLGLMTVFFPAILKEPRVKAK